MLPLKWRRCFAVFAACLVTIVVLDVLFPPPLDKLREVSTVVVDSKDRVIRTFPITDGRWRLRADLESLDSNFIEALLEYEDERFFRHFGVDFMALLRASGNLVRSREIVSGGSTITMQLARLLEPRKRTLGAKFFQIVRAFQLERRLSKQEILEHYLTLAPYGGNLEGVRSASWAYFEREPKNLTAEEIALLIALPQSPEARRPDLRPDNARVARERVLLRLASKGHWDEARAKEAQDTPIPTRHNFPSIAWHATDYLRSISKSEGAKLCSSLNTSLQVGLERFALRQSRSWDGQTQMAATVVDISTRNIIAHIGSARRDISGGWIDLARRYRSPGSTLKPFIYAMAFDDGLAAPQTQISDLPTRFQSYRPENFDRTFRGDVTISQALQHSLNIPAVQALEAIGPGRFASSLTFAGARPVLPSRAEREMGLALALGGAGMRMVDLAVLYAALGDSGRVRPLSYACDSKTEETTDTETRLMSPQSAEDVLSILASAPMPKGRMPSSLTQDAPQIAFKTGTSYGFRDAWAAGVSNGLAVVVWVGRADGAPRPGATGRSTALPLLFDVFDLASNHVLAKQSLAGNVGEAIASSTPESLKSFGEGEAGPAILFPPENTEIWMDKPDRGFVLSARGEGTLIWYVEGQKIVPSLDGRSTWYPSNEGFFRLDVVDQAGRFASTHVRITRIAD